SLSSNQPSAFASSPVNPQFGFNAKLAATITDAELALSNPMYGADVSASSVLIDAAFVSDKDIDVKSEHGAQHTTLRQGNAVYAPSSDKIVDTTFGTVKIAAGSLALVMADDNRLAVYNVDDARHDAVVVTLGSRKLTLSPGKSVVIAPAAVKEFQSINPC